jgi:hypothetical protein
MAAFSDYLENALLNEVFRNVNYTPAATVYVALFTSAPSDAGGGTELSGNGYSRQSVAFGAASGGAIANSATVSFSASGGNWGTVTHFAVYDASSAGNQLCWGSLSASKTVNDGDTLQFAAGDIDITLD